MLARLTIGLSQACAFLHACDRTFSFTLPSPYSIVYSPSWLRTSSAKEVPVALSLFDDAPEVRTPTENVLVDANGKALSPGTAVAIAANRSIKAYAVPKSAFGSFDPSTHEFIPQDESNAASGTRCLVLPAGLRGEVVKIYNTNEWDRAHPVLVKFGAGEDREDEGGYNVPKTFKMHFDADELEVLG